MRDTVHQGDLRGGHVLRPAVVRRVARVADQRGAIRPQLFACRRDVRHLDGKPGGLDHGVVVRLARVLHLPDVVAGVDARRAADVVRVDVPVAACRTDRGPEAERGQVSVDRRGQIRDPSPAVGLDPGVAPGQAGGHDRRLLEREPVERTVRRRKRDDEGIVAGRRSVLAGSASEHRLQAGCVQREGTRLPCVDDNLPSRRGLRP